MLRDFRLTYSLPCGSFVGLPYRILNIHIAKMLSQNKNYNGDYR